ncbi:hypothetical protein C8R43DRAFT_891868 [Mycena crocata]|nr:hypothetical protein C8R43DRAFT_891868 [Mycena crocata]
MLYNQDWERWESFMCTVFGEDFMYTPMSGMALHIAPLGHAPLRLQKGALPVNFTTRVASSTPTGTMTQVSSRATSNLHFTYSLHQVPVYDATNRDFNFKTDLPGMASNLPLWEGEIPVRSFVVAGYTAASYKGNGGGLPNQIHVGCNLMWAIVCGTPK